MAVWDARFSKKIDKKMESFNASLPFDRKLFEQDIKTSITHVNYLASINVLTKQEKSQLIHGLNSIKQKGLKGKIKTEHEDIHSLLEALLKDEIGALAGKLHTARSRNDLVATDFRLFISEKNHAIKKQLTRLLANFLEVAKANQKVILPGFTHLQGAQPITFSFYCLSYFFMFLRDHERLTDNQKRILLSPLGSGALAGINYPHPRKPSALELGFKGILPNAMDAVSSRDFLVEFQANLAIIMMHLSKFAEDMIIYSNKQFDFIEMDERYATGSSIMPNKKNPDALELIRGKTGRVYGNLMALLTTLKALPMAYNKDLQEDKEGSFDSIETVENCLELAGSCLKTITINAKKMHLATEKGFLQATDIADYLVNKGLPFREAHGVSGKIVKHLVKNEKIYSDLSLEDFKNFSSLFESDVFQCLDLNTLIENKKSHGSTSFREVKKQIHLAEKTMKRILAD